MGNERDVISREDGLATVPADPAAHSQVADGRVDLIDLNEISYILACEGRLGAMSVIPV